MLHVSTSDRKTSETRSSSPSSPVAEISSAEPRLKPQNAHPDNHDKPHLIRANMTVQEDVGAGAWLGSLTVMEERRINDPDLMIY